MKSILKYLGIFVAVFIIIFIILYFNNDIGIYKANIEKKHVFPKKYLLIGKFVKLKQKV